MDDLNENETSDQSAYWRVGRVAQHFDVGVSTVWRWTRDGDIPEPVRIGGVTRWLRAKITAIQ